jgi:uncharacterized delta-60 repeat protein
MGKAAEIEVPLTVLKPGVFIHRRPFLFSFFDMNSSRIFSFLLALMGKATTFRLLFIAFAVLLTVVFPVVAQTPDSFNPNAGEDGGVDCLAVQADGKVLVGGDFSILGGQMRKYFARLNADGSLDFAFNPDANGYVSSFAVQGDGKILVGGRFTAIGGQTRNYLARLNADGSLDAAFNPNANGDVNSIVVQGDGKILIGGDFTVVGGQMRNYVARLNADGSLDTAFNSDSAEGYVWVRSLAVQTDGKIVVGGWFTTFGGQPCNYIARLNANGSLDTAFNPDADSVVSSLVVQADGKILVGGSFSTIGGQTRNRIARLNADGSLDTSFNADANRDVDSIAVQADGKILVGGSFTIFSEQVRNNIARLNADGSLDTGFNPNVNSFNPNVYRPVSSLAVQADGKVLVGGRFFDIDGQTRRGIARLNNDTVAMSSLAVSGSSQINWTRGGSAPEVTLVTFERWTGSAWKALGNATRVVGGWRMTGLSLPVRGWVRARGHTSGGSQNGSAGVVEQMAVYGGGAFPDIAVSAEGLGNIAAGAATLDFGALDWTATSSVTRVLTVTNNGNATLRNLSVSLAGVDKANFTLGSLPSTSLAPGASMTFTIGFLPRATGLLGCTLAIASNDGDEAPFKLALQGTGSCRDLNFNQDADSDITSIVVQADGKILVGGWFGTIGEQARNRIARLNADGSLDASFNPSASGDFNSIVVETEVNCLAVQADGKILVGGAFTNLGGQPRNRIARLNADGSLDTSFNPNANWRVYSLWVQADGKILIGGDFTAVGGQTRNHIARLNADGSLDTSFNPNADGRINSIAVQGDGKILLGGWFNTLGGQTRNRIARLNADGSLDADFNPDADGSVDCLALQADGKVLAGGWFHHLGAQPRKYLARFNANGSVDAAFNPDADGGVSSLAVQTDGNVLVGGYFTIFGKRTRNHIARLNTDGSLDAAFNPDFGSYNPAVYESVKSLALQADGKVLVGGHFSTLGGQPLSCFARLTNNTAATSTLAVTPGRIGWTRLGSAPEVGQVTFERWTGSTWATLGKPTRFAKGWHMMGFWPPVRGWVRASGRTSGGSFVRQIAHYGRGFFPDVAVSVEGLGNVSAGTAIVDFGTVDWTAANAMTRTITVTNNGNATLSGLAVSLSGADPASFTVGSLSVTSLAPGASSSFTIGFLPHATGLLRCTLSIASNDADESPFDLVLQGTGNCCDLGFNPNADGGVNCFALQADGKILVGGWFNTLGGQTRNHIARLNADGSLDADFNPNADGGVDCLAVQADGKILVGGNFTAIGGQTRNRIARLNSDGSLDATFNPNANRDVYCIGVQADGKILVGGYFTAIGGQTRNRIARLNTDGSLDAIFNPNANSVVTCLAMQADGKILVGGSFSTLVGQPRNRIARLNADGSLDTVFNPNANGNVNALAVQADGKILVGGYFTTLVGQPRNCLARLNGDGSLDASFNPEANHYVNSVAVQADGKILVGGESNSLVRLNADGSLSTAFNSNVDGSVYSLAMQADGEILVGGGFTTVSGQARNYLARLINDTAAMSSLVATSASQVDWTRGGSAPEVSEVTFERWTGSAWAGLGNATRVAGGWRLTELSLPASGEIRAQGRTSGGYFNGSSGLVEQIVFYAFPELALEAPTSAVKVKVQASTAEESGVSLLDPPALDLQPDGSAQLTFQGIPGETYVVERSTNLSEWTPLQTLVADNAGTLEFSDPSPPSPNGFYRLVKPVAP